MWLIRAVRSLGAEYVGHRLWQELGFNHTLLEAGCSRHWLPLCEALVVGRLVAPGSERHSWAWMHAYFGANWTLIPVQTDHPFRLKLDTDSGPN
jgi:hypothetical protein